MKSISIELEPKSDIGTLSIDHADIFVYDNTGMKNLLLHQRVEGTKMKAELPARTEYLIAAVANAPGEFNITALNHFDSLETIEMDIASDNPAKAIMSGTSLLQGKRSTKVYLEPLLSRVILYSITNYYEDDTLLENPRIQIKNINSKAQLFKKSGFPVYNPFDTKIKYLPCDIGLYTQYPKMEFYLYPNDLPDPNEGNPATTMELYYETKGKTHKETIRLHPLERNTTTVLDLKIKP